MEHTGISKITYTLASNFDPKLVEKIIEIDKEKNITSLFGKLNNDIFGGGRPSSMLPDVSFNELKKHVEICKKNNIGFNYLLNPMCLDNRDIIPGEHKKIILFLKKLSDINITHVTVNAPYLAKIIKTQFPHFKITLGIFAGVHSLQLVKYWEDFGISEITLGHEVNRRFSYLEKLMQYTKKSGIKLRLIANNGCLNNCPNAFYHGNCMSHSSQYNKSGKSYKIDYNYLDCTYQKIDNPIKFITSSWIRPEDIKYYEDICKKTGNYNLSIKLLERTNTTDFLIKVLKAYLNRSFDGNLLDLLNWYGTNVNNKKYLNYLNSKKSSNNTVEMNKYISLLNFPKISIDNKKLNGFIQKFINKNECYYKICSDNFINDKVNSYKNRNTCNYCKEWITKSIKYDKKEREEWLEKANSFYESFFNIK